MDKGSVDCIWLYFAIFCSSWYTINLTDDYFSSESFADHKLGDVDAVGRLVLKVNQVDWDTGPARH